LIPGKVLNGNKGEEVVTDTSTFN